jgi:hypothetical protein
VARGKYTLTPPKPSSQVATIEELCLKTESLYGVVLETGRWEGHLEVMGLCDVVSVDIIFKF